MRVRDFEVFIEIGSTSSEKLEKFLLEFGDIILRMKEIQISKDDILWFYCFLWSLTVVPSRM